MRIALTTRHIRAPFLPLALLYLKTTLIEWAGVDASDIEIIEFAPDAGVDDMARRLDASAPDVIGVSCYVWNGRDLLDAVARVKQRRPGVRIVAGGPEVGPVAAEILARHDAVDVVVTSEGERPFADLISRWRRDTPIDDVPGVWSRSPDGLRDHGPAPVMRLDDLPSPHARGWIDPTERVACVETQRGCVFRCSFCFYNKDLSIRNRRFDMTRVENELRYWLDQDIAELYLMDPVFNLNASRAKAICRFIAAHNTRRIPIHTEAWAEFIDDEMAALMRAAHFAFVEIGLQTVDEDTLEVIDRRFRKPAFIDGLAHLRRHGVPFEIHVIGGLPGDDVEALRQSVAFAASLSPTWLAVYDLLVLPGTQLRRDAAALGVTFASEPPYRVLATAEIPPDAMRDAQQWALGVPHLWPSHTLALLRRETGATFLEQADAWVTWCARTGHPVEKVADGLPAFVDDGLAARGPARPFYGAMARLERDGPPRTAPRR